MTDGVMCQPLVGFDGRVAGWEVLDAKPSRFGGMTLRQQYAADLANIQQGCAIQARLIRDYPGWPLRVHLNLRWPYLDQPGFAAAVDAAIGDSGLADRSGIVFELVETDRPGFLARHTPTEHRRLEVVHANLMDLADVEIRLWTIDDAGTPGTYVYSPWRVRQLLVDPSYPALWREGCDAIKLDPALLQPQEARRLHAFLRLALRLRKRIVFEYITDEVVFQRVLRLIPDDLAPSVLFQGNHFSPKVSVDAFMSYLAKTNGAAVPG